MGTKYLGYVYNPDHKELNRNVVKLGKLCNYITVNECGEGVGYFTLPNGTEVNFSGMYLHIGCTECGKTKFVLPVTRKNLPQMVTFLKMLNNNICKG